jgi:Tfp pilus assembly protein PilX
MLLKRKEFCRGPFRNKGSMLITLIITMLIFSVLAVAMLSLTSTSIFSQLNTSSTTRAAYIAKSGYNYLASVYKNATATEAARNLALENLNNVNFQLLNNNGSFTLTVKPSYLRFNENTRKQITGTSKTLIVKFPGADLSYTIPASGTMAVYKSTGYMRFTYTSVIGSANNYTLNGVLRVGNTSFYIEVGESIVPVVSSYTNAQTLSSGGSLRLATNVGSIFPLRFGFFEIPGVSALSSYVFSYDHRTGDYFYDVTNAASPNVAFPTSNNNIPASSLIYAHTSAAITSTGTFHGPGPAVSNTYSRMAILGYNVGGNSDATTAPQDIPGVDGWVAFGGGATGPGIALNTGTETIGIGQGLNDTAGVAWYAGNSDAADCATGICTFGTGIRAYFTFRDSNGTTSSGDGFMFMIMNGTLNDTTKRGGTVSGSGMGELMGYAGPGNTADGLGLQPPKIAIEFDRYTNANVNSAGCLNGRNDATTGTTNHMALMFWGDNTTGSCGTGSPINGSPAVSADDNIHGAGTAGSATVPSNSSSTDGLGGYFATSFANTTSRVFRMELTRYVTPNTNGNYNYNVKAWIDCTACADVSVPYSGASTAQINRTIELSPDLHTDFNKMVFGFTQGTGAATQNITISTFDIFFPGACNYSLSPNTLPVPRAAGTGSITVGMSGSCSWTAASDGGAGLAITSGASGAGSGTINYSYTLNSGTTRTGIITVTSPAGPQTFTLTQTNP